MEEQIFYDLGSGSGKVLFAASLCHPFIRCIKIITQAQEYSFWKNFIRFPWISLAIYKSSRQRSRGKSMRQSKLDIAYQSCKFTTKTSKMYHIKYVVRLEQRDDNLCEQHLLYKISDAEDRDSILKTESRHNSDYFNAAN